jgi:hypothetical protein
MIAASFFLSYANGTVERKADAAIVMLASKYDLNGVVKSMSQIECEIQSDDFHPGPLRQVMPSIGTTAYSRSRGRLEADIQRRHVSPSLSPSLLPLHLVRASSLLVTPTRSL